MIRQNIEGIALEPFKALSEELGLPHFSGQGLTNLMPKGQTPSFQFGDLRIELPSCTVVVEVESSGGVTNIAKYWESFESHRIEKPVKLIHVFLQKSDHDYESHIILWRFLNAQIQKALGPKWEAYCFGVRVTSKEALGQALALFRRILEENLA